MAHVTRLSSVAWETLAPGVWRASIGNEDPRGRGDMLAEFLRIGEGGRLDLTPSAASDRYLFVITGRASLSDGRARHDLGPRTLAALREADRGAVSAASADEVLLVSVTAPAPGTPSGAAGSAPAAPANRSVQGTRALVVLDAAKQPGEEERESGKRRIYLVTEALTGSKRAHAMIVTYRAATVTPRHQHPNASSLFVVLEGHGIVLANGREVQVESGTVIHYPRADRHALRSADERGMSFLEFHIPAEYETVNE